MATSPWERSLTDDTIHQATLRDLLASIEENLRPISLQLRAQTLAYAGSAWLIAHFNVSTVEQRGAREPVLMYIYFIISALRHQLATLEKQGMVWASVPFLEELHEIVKRELEP